MAPQAQHSHLKRGRGPGLVWFIVGIALATTGVYVTISTTYPAPIGLMLGLVLLYVVATYLLVWGLRRLRAGEDERDPVGADITPGKRSLRCALLGHKEVFAPRTELGPPEFRCRRCGAHAPGHLNVGHAWMCDLPVVEHVYDRVGKTADAPEYWRCRRCGARRYTAPVSAGETLDATRTDLLWVKRYDD